MSTNFFKFFYFSLKVIVSIENFKHFFIYNLIKTRQNEVI